MRHFAYNAIHLTVSPNRKKGCVLPQGFFSYHRYETFQFWVLCKASKDPTAVTKKASKTDRNVRLFEMLFADESSFIFIGHIQTNLNVFPFLCTYSEHHIKVSLQVDVSGNSLPFERQVFG